MSEKKIYLCVVCRRTAIDVVGGFSICSPDCALKLASRERELAERNLTEAAELERFMKAKFSPGALN